MLLAQHPEAQPFPFSKGPTPCTVAVPKWNAKQGLTQFPGCFYTLNSFEP